MSHQLKHAHPQNISPRLRHIVGLLVGGRLRRLSSFALLSFSLITGFLVFIYAPLPLPDRSLKRVLEFGWDTPRLQDIPQFISAAQNLPFDGLILDIATPRHPSGQAWTLFSDQRVDQAQLNAAAEGLTGVTWGRLTDNFLRVNVYPASVDWFDEDFQNVLDNLEAVAGFAQRQGFKGIMLDTEQYRGVTIFDYRQRPYRQDYPFEAYSLQVFERGREVMIALNRGFPGITVLYTYGLTRGPQPRLPDILATHPYGLLVPFIEGMIVAADDGTTLVDAFEGAYTFSQELQFLVSYKWIRGITRDFYTSDRHRYGETVQAGFGLWIDHHCGENGLEPEGCLGGYRSEAFGNALSLAQRYSDRYVWVYSQNINWYTGEGIPVEWLGTVRANGQ